MEEEYYDYQQHDFCMLIYLDERYFNINAYKMEIQNEAAESWVSSPMRVVQAGVSYNQELDRIIRLRGSSSSEKFKTNQTSDNIICINDSLNQLYQICAKSGQDQDNSSKLTLKAIGKSLQFFVNEAKENIFKKDNTTTTSGNLETSNFHYVFVVPLGCADDGFEKKIVRPLFTAANLYNDSVDHPKKLAVFTELESLVQLFYSQQYEFRFASTEDNRLFNVNWDFKKKDQYLISKFDTTDSNVLHWSCHAFEFEESIFLGGDDDGKNNSFRSTLVSAKNSVVVKATTGAADGSMPGKIEIGTRINKALFQLLQDKDDSGQTPRTLQKEWNGIRTLIVEYFYDDKTIDKFIRSVDSPLDVTLENAVSMLDFYQCVQKNGFQTKSVLLNTNQLATLEKTSPIEIYSTLLAPIQKEIKTHLQSFLIRSSNSSSSLSAAGVSKHFVIPFIKDRKDAKAKRWLETWLAKWITGILFHYEKTLDYRLVVGRSGISNNEEKETSQSNRKQKQKKKELMDGGCAAVSYDGNELLYQAWLKLVKKIQHTNATVPPYFLHYQKDIQSSSPVPLSPQEEERKKIMPKIIISIYISFKSTKFSCVILGKDSRVETILYDSQHQPESILQPLGNFFKGSTIMDHTPSNGSTTLEIDEAIMSLIKKYANTTQHMDDLFKSHTVEITLIAKAAFEKTPPVKEKKSEKQTTQNPKCIQMFLILYFWYLNNKISAAVKEKRQHIGSTYTQTNSVDYIALVEKQLLVDGIVDGKEVLRELMTFSGFVGRGEDTVKRLRIITQGEGLLPVLQEKFYLDLGIKWYYLQVHLHKDWVNLTLNQVVKAASKEEEEEATTVIVVEDKIVPIENVYDSFCKSLWNSALGYTEKNGLSIYHCALHKLASQEENSSAEFYTQENYKEILVKLKRHIHELFSYRDIGVHLDERRVVELSDRCNCSMSLSMRDLIEVALTPTIKEITTVVSSALVNPELLGRFKINHVFMLLGNILHCNYNSATHTLVSKMIQSALDGSNRKKEIQPNCFYYTDTVESLIQPKIHQKLFSYDSVKKGIPYPVSRESYGFCLSYIKDDNSGIGRKLDLLCQIDGTDYLTSVTNSVQSPVVILRRGQLIPHEGIQKTLYYAYEDEFVSSGLMQIELYKFHSDNILSNILDQNSGSQKYMEKQSELLYMGHFRASQKYHVGNRFGSRVLLPVTFIIKFDNPASLLKFEIGYGRIAKDPSQWVKVVDIGQPLTLAYF